MPIIPIIRLFVVCKAIQGLAEGTGQARNVVLMRRHQETRTNYYLHNQSFMKRRGNLSVEVANDDRPSSLVKLPSSVLEMAGGNMRSTSIAFIKASRRRRQQKLRSTFEKASGIETALGTSIEQAAKENTSTVIGGCLSNPPGPLVSGSTNVEVKLISDVGKELWGGIVKPEGMLDSNSPAPERACSRPVPKILHFIWVKRRFPEEYAARVAKHAKLNPAWQIMLWLEKPLSVATKEARLIIESITPPVIVKDLAGEAHQFRNLDILREHRMNPGALSDWLRLEVVYLHGGIYLDTDANAIHGLDNYGALFRWPFVSYTGGGYGNICTGVFGADKQSGFLNFAMNAARENCKSYNRCGQRPYHLEAIGPPFFTTAFLRYNSSDILMIGQEYLVYNHTNSVMFQTLDASWRS